MLPFPALASALIRSAHSRHTIAISAGSRGRYCHAPAGVVTGLSGAPPAFSHFRVSVAMRLISDDGQRLAPLRRHGEPRRLPRRSGAIAGSSLPHMLKNPASARVASTLPHGSRAPLEQRLNGRPFHWTATEICQRGRPPK